jgi:NTP pyrophosphatase (non-canonical NTP hydrolase)
MTLAADHTENPTTAVTPAITTADSYQQIARTTAVYPHLGANLTYPALGLAGETGEVLEKILAEAGSDDVIAELGDALWYIANLATEAGIPMSSITEHNTLPEAEHAPLDALEAGSELVIAATKAVETIKKAHRDDNGQLTDARTATLTAQLTDTLLKAASVAASYQSTLTQAAQRNAAKLASRTARGVISGSGDTR